MAPLGPLRHIEQWVYQLGYQADDEGYELIEYWLDEIGNEYVSLDHIGQCAVARALEL